MAACCGGGCAIVSQLRIMHYLPDIRLEQGGPVRVVIDLANGLVERGAEVIVAASDVTDVPARWSAGGWPRVEHLPMGRVPGMLSRESLGRAGAALEGADVLHVHGMWSPAGVQISRAAQQRGIPYIISPHGMLDDWALSQKWPKKKAFLMLAGRRWLANATAIHFTAKAEFEQSRKFTAGRGTVIPNPIDMEEYRELPGPERAQGRFAGLNGELPVLLFLGRVHSQKGPDVLIKAAGRLARDGQRCSVLLAGPGEAGYIESLRQLAASEGIGESVHMLGMVTGPDKLSLYQAADLLVLPTCQENFGLVLFESLLCETPVISTPGVDTWPELEASSGGRIAAGESAEMARAIAEMIGDRAALAERGRTARKWTLEFLDTGRIFRMFEEMYRAARPQDASAPAQGGSHGV